MAYDSQAESLRLIRSGLPDRPVRLSRRRRFAPVAVDVDGDIAATRFLRRGVGCHWDETHLLAVDGRGTWRQLGGSASSSGEDLTADEFERARVGLAPHDVVVEGSSGALRDTRRPLPWGSRWVHAGEILVGSGIAELRVADRRLSVPYHGHLIVVWGSRRPPTVTAHDDAGRTVATIALPRER
ncbi:hypothetical protein [Micromonospora sediminimaris]|uniref:Uncharacterized protein n=1 Tax=Micromonospora sediminimaris TaxID=547162 RepID=A0A9W5XKZ7_9ACTN|nr:hypothetical protein [Micromonospora sediminimaris]GIJ34502.1 hypothetical protein Vse01_36500 [Micromonospora sediminimaris]SFD39386.1 hypothetical protein SAMN05216284_11616 [Micromonospora sediminimaris]